MKSVYRTIFRPFITATMYATGYKVVLFLAQMLGKWDEPAVSTAEFWLVNISINIVSISFIALIFGTIFALGYMINNQIRRGNIFTFSSNNAEKPISSNATRALTNSETNTMNMQNAISAKTYAKQNGMKESEVVENLHSGELVGIIYRGSWFVDGDQSRAAMDTIPNTNIISPTKDFTKNESNFMENQPLDSTEQTKLLILVLLGLPAIGFGVGVIPALFLLFGVFMMKRNGDFSHIEIATKNTKTYLILAGIVAVVITIIAGISNGLENAAIIGIVLIIPSIAYQYFLKELFYEPLSTHRVWVEKNGIFTSNKMKQDKDKHGLNIIDGERTKTYSVADELIKWGKLQEDGHVTQEQYEEAKNKLLKGE